MYIYHSIHVSMYAAGFQPNSLGKKASKDIEDKFPNYLCICILIHIYKYIYNATVFNNLGIIKVWYNNIKYLRTQI